MARWFNKRWAWAAVVGATVSAGFAAVAADAPPQKVGAVISLNIDGKGEREFKVLKCEKQPDGSYHSELKDAKTGETITLVDKPDAAPAKGTEPPMGADTAPPKAKPRTTDPMVPPLASALPDPAKDKDKDKDKRPILGRVFGDKDKTPAGAAPKMEAPTDPAKKPGLLARVFGPKKPTGPSMPAATVPANTKPTTSAPPPVLPVPPGGLTGGSSPLPPFPGTTTEPPRVMPTKPFTPPQPAPMVPAPAPPVTSAPTVPAPLPAFPAPTPTPTPLPALPVPLPAVPPATGGGLPPLPIPPGGTSSAKPLQVVVPVGYVPAQVAFDRDVEPFVVALQSMSAPSARLTAAKALAEGRHRSTDGVKGVLFQAAQMDPCGEVRAACINHLCKLGYYSPHFLGHIQAACGDPDPQVSDAAKAACAKMLAK